MHRVYAWESYPEYIATQQYSRCLGRILVTLPPRHARTLAKPLIRGAVLIAQGIAGAHAETSDDNSIDVTERARFRDTGLQMIGISRTTIRFIHDRRLADRANVMAALELLERAEEGLRSRPLPGARSTVADA